jgi:hypothetical protein
MLRKTYLIAFFFTLVCGFSAAAQSVDDVVAKNTEARGGEAKIKAVKSIKSVGKFVFRGQEADYAIYQKRPHLVRQEVTVQGVPFAVRGFDGTNAWQKSSAMGSGRISPANEKSLRDLSDLDGAFVDYKSKGHTVELLGKEDDRGTSVFKLKLVKASGETEYHFIDAATGLTRKITQKTVVQGGEAELEIVFSDYKDVNGTKVSFSRETKIDGQVLNQVILEKVEYDISLDEVLFKAPANAGGGN